MIARAASGVDQRHIPCFSTRLNSNREESAYTGSKRNHQRCLRPVDALVVVVDPCAEPDSSAGSRQYSLSDDVCMTGLLRPAGVLFSATEGEANHVVRAAIHTSPAQDAFIGIQVSGTDHLVNVEAHRAVAGTG